MPSFLQYAGAGLLGGASQVATDIGEAGLKAKEEEKKRKAAAEGMRLKQMYEMQKLGVQHGLARKNIAYEQGLKDERFAAKQQLKGYDDYLASETAAKQAELDREHEKEIQGMKGEQRIGLEEKKGDKKLEQIIVKSNLTRDRKVELFNMSSNLKMLMNSNDNRTKLMANELNNLAKIYIARHGNLSEERIEKMKDLTKRLGIKFDFDIEKYKADRTYEGKVVSANAGVQRSWMAAQSVLKKIESSERIAKWNNEAKVGIARLNADTRIDIANMVKETTLTANQARIEAKERNLVYDRETKELLQAEGFLSASILQAERFGYQAEAASLKAQRDIVLANLNNKAAQQRTETRADTSRYVADKRGEIAVKLQGMRNIQRIVEKNTEFENTLKVIDRKHLNKKNITLIENEYKKTEGLSAHERKMAQIKLKGKLAKELDDSKQKQNNERLNKTLANRENIVRLRIASVEKRDRRKLNLAYRKHGFDVRKMSHKTFADWALSASTTEDTSGQITGASGVTINLGGKRKGILDENLHSYLLQYGSDNDYIIPQPYEPTLREIWTGMIKKGYARSVQDMTQESYNKVFKALLTKHGRWIATKFRRPTESEFGAAALVANSQSQQPTPEQ